MKYIYLTFDNVTQAIIAETSLDIPKELVPVTPNIDPGCGFALKIDYHYIEELKKLLCVLDLNYKNTYILDYSSNKYDPVVQFLKI